MVLALMALGLLYLNALPPEDNFDEDPWVNEDIDEPISDREALCLPRGYHYEPSIDKPLVKTPWDPGIKPLPKQ